MKIMTTLAAKPAALDRESTSSNAASIATVARAAWKR
jgi:hypothetical protein